MHPHRRRTAQRHRINGCGYRPSAWRARHPGQQRWRLSRVKLLEMREADWEHVLDINLKADCFATIAFVKALMASGKGGWVTTSPRKRSAAEGVPGLTRRGDSQLVGRCYDDCGSCAPA